MLLPLLDKHLQRTFIILITLALISSYSTFLIGSKVSELGYLSNIVAKTLTENQDKKYLQVVPFYPQLYIENNISSPDRHFQPFYILPFFNTDYEKEVATHTKIDQDKLSKTLFVFPFASSFEKELIKSYKNSVDESFKLTLLSSYKIGSLGVEIYVSEK